MKIVLGLAKSNIRFDIFDFPINIQKWMAIYEKRNQFVRSKKYLK